MLISPLWVVAAHATNRPMHCLYEWLWCRWESLGPFQDELRAVDELYVDEKVLDITHTHHVYYVSLRAKGVVDNLHVIFCHVDSHESCAYDSPFSPNAFHLSSSGFAQPF